MGSYDNWKKLKKILEDRSNKSSFDFSHQVLIMMDEIEKKDIEDMHNAIHTLHLEIFNHKPTLEDMERLLNIMPEHLQHYADQRGWNDEEVRDLIHEWMKNKFS